MTIYTDNGYKNRDDYLRCVSEEYGVPLEVVVMLADLLGPDEDFDGLVTSLADYEGDANDRHDRSQDDSRTARG